MSLCRMAQSCFPWGPSHMRPLLGDTLLQSQQPERSLGMGVGWGLGLLFPPLSTGPDLGPGEGWGHHCVQVLDVSPRL